MNNGHDNFFAMLIGAKANDWNGNQKTSLTDHLYKKGVPLKV
ncbi:hypothetical protein BN000_05500 [Neobacillus massiliamazoniensis]|uniref:Uncharacterized protein n=1 Tax=Neobacillus massiliamazoniensis TaxID=1499688 RepID=A0A0U1P5L6_9BACI|nr:hypothetical protein BN000_05500 [Neobacillus massiliamazoniensis]